MDRGPLTFFLIHRMQTIINRTKALAVQPTTKFKLVIGHGTLIQRYPRVPEDTYIIFLSKPGHILSSSSILSNPQVFRYSYIRNAITGATPKWNVRPVRLGMWKEHVYAPGNVYPDMNIEFFDYNPAGFRTPGTPSNAVFGVHTINTTNRRNTRFKGSSSNLSNIIRFGGKGIYIVASCRTSPWRGNNARVSAVRNFELTGGAQTTVRRMGRNDPNVNRGAQALENMQARMAARKRTAANSVNKATAKRKKPLFYFPVLPFAPGRPTPASTKRRRRPKTLRRT